MAKFIITDTESGHKLEILTNDDRHFPYYCLGEDGYRYILHTPKTYKEYLRTERFINVEKEEKIVKEQYRIILFDKENELILTREMDGYGEHIKEDNFNKENFDYVHDLENYHIFKDIDSERRGWSCDFIENYDIDILS